MERKGEKDGELTRRLWACLGKPEEVRSVRISSATREEEEDAVVSVVDLGSIPSWHTERTTC
jgi:hypothetical protein